MRIGVLGTGPVGPAIATRLTELGHEVMMGARDAANPKAAGVGGRPRRPRRARFADAVARAEVVVNATAGTARWRALRGRRRQRGLAGKVLLDVSQPDRLLDRRAAC